MRRLSISLALLALFLSSLATDAQQVVDRIVARIEGDVILLSDVQELSRYQLFIDGKSETDNQILDRLIDQWIVRTEAETSRFPLPSTQDVQRNVDRIRRSFASPEEYESRKKQSGLSDKDLSEMAAAQLYLGNYLDSRFRPSIQVDSKTVEEYYQTGVLASAKARGQQPPTLEAARDYIQEYLVQQGITEEANRWLKESRAHLHVDNLLDEGAK